MRRVHDFDKLNELIKAITMQTSARNQLRLHLCQQALVAALKQAVEAHEFPSVLGQLTAAPACPDFRSRVLRQ